MAEKINKTARASLGQRGSSGSIRSCPQCGEEMVVTKLVRSGGNPSGMYWVCYKDDYRVKPR